MKSIYAHLTFNGDCTAAMNFYQSCLGGTLYFQTLTTSPLSAAMPAKMKKCIVHAELRNENLVLMASDLGEDTGLMKGNALSLVLNCNSEKEIRSCYKKLSKDGLQTQPLQRTQQGGLLGTLKDKFGNNWILYHRQINSKIKNGY